MLAAIPAVIRVELIFGRNVGRIWRAAEDTAGRRFWGSDVSSSHSRIRGDSVPRSRQGRAIWPGSARALRIPTHGEYRDAHQPDHDTQKRSDRQPVVPQASRPAAILPKGQKERRRAG